MKTACILRPNYDLNTLLLDESVIKNKYDETPVSIACRKNHFFVLRYILSKMKNKADKLRLIEMVWKYEITKTADNYRSKDDFQLEINCILTCCLFQHLGCLKELLSCYDGSSIKSVIAFKNNKGQNIYRFIKNVETCKFLEKTYNCITFGFKEFNEGDVDEMTPFMSIVKHAQKLKFIIWILNQCKTDSEKLKLIYNCNKDGENALDLAPFASIQELFLIKTVKTILSTYQRIKDITFIVPIFLHSLKTGRIDLTQFLLSLLNSTSDRKKLINCSNKHGLNAALAACKGGKQNSLQFLLSHKLFDPNLIFKKDKSGLTAIHYSCYSDSISVLKSILKLYQENGNGNFTELMFLRDKLGNIPFDYLVRKSNLALSPLFKWIVANCFSDFNIFDSKREQKRKILQMMFTNKNYLNQVSLIEIMLRQNDMLITQCIKEYFDEVKKISDRDVEMVGHILMYLYNFNWTLSQHIVSKIKDNNQLYKILSVENSDKYTLLVYVCKDSSIDIINWLLRIMPTDHPTLFSAETVYGKTALMYLVERALLFAADNLLKKITDHSQRMQLIQHIDHENKSILDDAKQQDIPNRMQWIESQMQMSES